MRTLMKLAAALLFLALIGMLVWRGFSVREPSYQGRSMSVWLEEYNRAGALDKTGPVDEAIRAMGTHTLPRLLAHLKRKDSPLKRRLFLLAEKHHLAFFPPPRQAPFFKVNLASLARNHPNAGVRCASVEALAGYYGTPHGDHPELVVHTLRKATGDPEARVRESAREAAQRIGVGGDDSADGK